MGSTLGIITGLGFWSGVRRRKMILRIFDECASQGFASERLSIPLIQDCLSIGDVGLGMLTLVIGIANTGVRWPGGSIPIDPAGDNWRGRPAGLGKHFTDHDKGGLGVAHLDSGSLQDVYDKWGCPLPESARDMNFNPILTSRYRDQWVRWARELVQDRNFQIWIVEYWLKKYWQPARQGNTRTTAIINARILNSAQSWGRQAAGRTWDQQEAIYIAKKGGANSNRGQRTIRQVNYCERVRLLADMFS